MDQVAKFQAPLDQLSWVDYCDLLGTEHRWPAMQAAALPKPSSQVDVARASVQPRTFAETA